MRKQRNNPQLKGKEEASGKMLNEIEATQLSDSEFKTMITRKFNELTMSFQKLEGNYIILTENYINMKEEIETLNKGQEEMKNTISELKNTVEGMKSRLDEVEDRISELEDRVENNIQKEQKKEKRLRKNEEILREMQDNMKCNNIRIIGISEGGEEEQGIENLVEQVMKENFPNLMREEVTQIQETQRVPIKRKPKRPTSRQIIIKMICHFKTKRES
ncbi:hypothetical protein HJG60_010618 [Phyllostomus discolor]|uniref:L1 transposable element RRM domain-containing protein n=1 Tax=Phyllostomus discolor TaxID=89673 RepID=A0A834AH93_9CHIR|nr:hypothetical protein HJG60_010618 [Phyllostomus discolor]